MTAGTLIPLCRACAHGIYATRPPTQAYGEAVARLLMGTAATESLLVYRRQGGFGFGGNRGAWGLWQTEQGSVMDGVRMLADRDALRENAARFLWGDEGDPEMDGLLAMDIPALLRLIHSWDRVAVLFARLHYLRFDDPVPRDPEGQAAYWKRYYNTVLGAGGVTGYLTHWRDLVEVEL